VRPAMLSGPPPFDQNILPLDIPEFMQAFAERLLAGLIVGKSPLS
jgi:hypothetical protein